MAISSYFFNAVASESGAYDRTYDAEDMTSYLDKIVGTGVFPSPTTNLQVVAASGMQVTVKAGQAWINGHKMILDADMNLDVAASDVLLSRIDDVICYVDHTTRTMGVEIKRGTAAATPSAPALVRTAMRYELCLARITVSKGVTVISQTAIRDTRGNSALCGWVQGLIQQLDSTGLFAQFQTSFDDWFSTVKETLSTATLLTKFEQSYTTKTANESTFNVRGYITNYNWALDILEVRINGLTLSALEYSNNEGKITLATPIADAGTPITFAVYKSTDGSNAETTIGQVAELQKTVGAIENGMYIATGEDDNIKLSKIVKDFLSGANDYRQLEIDIYGDLAVTDPATTTGDVSIWFDFAVTNSTRRVRLDFAHASRIVVDAGNKQSRLFDGDIEIDNMQAVLNSAGDWSRAFNTACTVHNSALWMNGAGSLVGAIGGNFVNCRMSVTSDSGAAFGFNVYNSALRLRDCEILAYNLTGVSAESVAVRTEAGQASNVLIMDGCSCPIRARGGYKQSHTVKVNNGLYSLTGNMLGKAGVFYKTGDGMSETGTMIVSK